MEHMPQLVGIMAFSQGARVATALLLYFARTSHPLRTRFRFAVLCCATYPPLWGDGETEAWAAADCDGGVGRRKVEVPSLHLVGSKDAWKGEAETMAREVWSDEVGKEVWIFEGGHQVPLGREDGTRVAEWVKQFL
ncbi:hypothetical protein DE146DRAFT_643347 [Phaeosphaeria sp. MPI-PUGE-AT-0046c]|nr:hypothetical protein DE146DRAFT_643347 [Phaeosphaeria sp. MPI-PUGE-AT-0046c]